MVQERPNADRLGRKGEIHFEKICNEADLDCSKSNPDRTGWDFIVEFPVATDSGRSLDSRPAPICCFIQVKTLFSHTRKFEMRLSSAERLAKQHSPAFIYVIKVDALTLDITEACLFHVMDEVLSKILRRLRKEEAAGNISGINKKDISFSTTRYGIRLEPTGEALRAALKAACGDGLQGYNTRKCKQLRQLGFEPRPYRASFRFRGLQDINELADVFLGLKKNIEIANLKLFEKRFGIVLPNHKFFANNNKLSIDPYPFDICTITFKSDMFHFPIVFEGNLYIPAIPDLPQEAFKFLLKSQMFSILISYNEIISSPLDQNP